MTLDFFQKLRENVENFPERVVFQSLSDAGRETFTYRQVLEQTGAIAAHLVDAGLRPGQRVGILMETHPRWGIAFLGAQSAGAVVVPLDTLHQPKTLAGLIRHSGCSCIIVSVKLLPLWRAVETELPETLPILIAGSEIPPKVPSRLPCLPRTLDEPLMILYTSGTTGDSKGAVLTARNVFRNVVEIVKRIGPTADDHFLEVLPLYHVLALVINCMIPLYLGARVTFLQSLEAQKILAAFREEGISIFVCVPQFYYLVYRRIQQTVERQPLIKRFLFRRLLAVSRFCNLWLGFNPGRWFFPAIHAQFGPRLRLFGVGGARFDGDIAERFRDLGFGLVQAYGMTETAALITVALHRGRDVGTAGTPLPHVEVRIAGGNERGVGEVLVRGGNVMLGYWENPAATAQALMDGWLHTGDLGYLDRRGCLHITGRAKDVIVLSSGKNIYPEEIERFYQDGTPFIKEICVVGVPEDGGERLHAVIVPDFEALKNHDVVHAYDAIRWHMEALSQRLPGHKRVLSMEIRQEPLPRTTTRKLKRFQVEQELGKRGARPAAGAEDVAPQTPVEERLFELIRTLKKAPAISPSMNLELDLGFTSLERVELLSAIAGSFGARIPEQEATKIHTVGEMAEAIERLGGGAANGSGGGAVSWRDFLRAPLDADEERIANAVLRCRPALEALRYLLARMIRLAARRLLWLRLEGIDRLPQAPFLMCPNHVSFLDAFLIIAAVPWNVSRQMFFLADTSYFEGPVRSRIGRWLKVVTLSPDRAVRSSLRLAAEGLNRGMVLCVFPEGERSIDGQPKVFRPGPAIVATELGLPVVPVAIRGAYEVWRRGSNEIRRHPVALVFGDPLAAAGKTAAAFNTELREAVRRLL
jgi:long-chain acyl-CoA synthetase